MSMMANAWAEARARLWGQRRHDYRAVFGFSEVRTLAQERVLADLARFCRAQRSCYETDARAHAFAEGRREVWLRIQQMLRLSDEQIAAMMEIQNDD